MNKHMQKIKDHLWGPTGSVLLHVIIVILLINFLVFKMAPDEPDIKIKITEMDTVEIPNRDDIDIEPAPEPDDDMVPIDRPLPDDFSPEPPEFDNPEPEMDVTPTDMPMMDGPLVLKDFASRTPSGRDKMRKKYSYGWGEVTEPAVDKALEWLKKNQIKEGANKGSWDPGSKSKDKHVALAGLGLLAFLAHGETTGSEKYGDTVLWAIEFLQRSQADNGAFCPLNQHGVYAHGIATYAISEAFAMTRIPYLKDSMDRAVERIVDGQQSGGGWNYAYKKGGRRDTSVASWQIQALKAAYMAESAAAGLDRALQKAADDLKNSFIAKSSQFSYTSGGQSHNVTPMAILCLQLIGDGRDNVTRAALSGIDDEQCSWETSNKWAMYRWYYTTQAKFHSGGSDWKDWNDKFAPAYVENQQDDGHWVPPNAGQDGHADSGYGPAFPTALGALTLQVYYRVLPSYQDSAIRRIDIDVDKGDERIKVKIM